MKMQDLALLGLKRCILQKNEQILYYRHSIYLSMKHKYRTRVQGESLQERIRDNEFKVMEQVMLPAFYAAFAVLAWLIYITSFQMNLPAAILISIIAVVLIIRGYFKVKKTRWVLKRYRKGLEGERLVGETLNRLSNESTFVFHDIPGNRFNVDHIIVSTRGIFVIETKHFNREICSKFFYDGLMIYRVMKDGRKFPCPKLLPQIDGEARFIEQEIEHRTDMKLPVIKVAILIGSYIDGTENFKDYWLLNESSFVTAFCQQKECLDDSVVKLVATHIRTMVEIDVDE